MELSIPVVMYVCGGLVSLLIGVVVYVFITAVKRTDTLESRVIHVVANMVEKSELVRLLNAYLDPITDDIEEIHELLKTLVEIRVRRKVVRLPKAKSKRKSR